MRLIIDLDQVLADTNSALLERVNKKYSLSVKHSDITTWNHSFGPSTYGIEINEALAEPEFVLSIPAMFMARECNDYFLKRGHEVIIATSRPDFCSESTRAWLIKQQILYRDLIFTHEKHLLEGSVLVDDSVENCMAWAQTGRFALLFDRPWNKSAPYDYHIVRRWTWFDIVSWVHINDEIFQELHQLQLQRQAEVAT